MNEKRHSIPEKELRHLNRAIDLARAAEKDGNLPVGCVIVLDDTVIATGANSTLQPQYHPGRHAEMEALQRVPVHLWPRAKYMTCYTTMEPCTMCFGALLLHRIGRIVFGASDKKGGATYLLPELPKYISRHIGIPEIIGPVAPELCDELSVRTFQILAEKQYSI
jgi:tRNA(adenine34) deaminase